MIIDNHMETHKNSDMFSVTSKYVLTWARVEAQGTQMAMLGSLKDNRELDIIQPHKPLIKPMHRQKHQKSRAVNHHPSRYKSSNTADPAAHHDDALHVERCAEVVERLTISKQSVKVLKLKEGQPMRLTY